MMQPKFFARSALAALALSLPLLLAAQPGGQSSAPATEPKHELAGDAACLQCHQKESASYAHTAHHLTSQLATPQTVLGPLQPGKETLTINGGPGSPAMPLLRFRMERRKDGIYETAETGWSTPLFQHSERMDIITGSGTRGQTYLFWQGDALYELPVSYWTDGHRWINSPGFTNGTASFSRPVNPACLECHATYIRPLSSNPETNQFDRTSFVPGISCESCHGSGLAHVAWHRQHPEAKQIPDTTILNPAHFSRERQLDLCAECHNGIQRTSLAPAFSYTPGHPLAEYFKPLPVPESDHPDVHGNQVGLLERSKCFQVSGTMTCSTCHNVHDREQTVATYSARCLTCHQWQACPTAKRMGHTSVTQCIGCHMPVQPTSVIVSETADTSVHATMRNHWIKVYPKAAAVKGTGPGL
ncbi:MAG: hypothetical protein KGK08_08970 [Acidobacteriota bacterium]|nr:hypothetical protein [Acidobacteriota bacterium]